MRSWATARLLWLLVAISASLVSAKDEPKQNIKSFDSAFIDLVYFDDSDVIVFTDTLTREVWRSTDAGFEWHKIDGVEGASEVIKHPYNADVAIILGEGETHYITKDRGKKWNSFKTETYPYPNGRVISWHGSDPDRILFHGEDCTEIEIFCTSPMYYTEDGFDSSPKLLYDDAIACLWAKSTPEFTSNDDQIDESRIFCNVEGEFSFFSTDSRIVYTDDYFSSAGTQPLLEGDRPVTGIVNIASVTGYLAAAANSKGSKELALYVTHDGQKWHRAEFGKHTIEEDAYTILESTNYSMQVDVLSTGDAGPVMGTLFTSNSDGQYFTNNVKYTNRNEFGFVDFEKVSNIPGIVLINIVDNGKEIEGDKRGEKDIITQISFDDGREWHDLKIGGEHLHLHSVTDQRNIGRVYSSPAPGIIMGVGNTGKRLKSRDKSDTYISDDAGMTWRLALEKPHLYEIGDSGGIVVAIEDAPTDKIQYSLDHGRNWTSIKLDISHKIKANTLTTTQDSTSLKFIIVGKDSKQYSFDDPSQIIAIDFSGLHERECKDDDFEDWPARLDDDGEPKCLMGATITYRRRKADSDCFVNADFKEPVAKESPCKCTDADYECDFGFVKDGGKCVPDGPLSAPAGACEDGAKTYKGSDGYRLIPGNKCDGGVQHETVDRDCDETTTPPASGNINSTITINMFKKDKQFEEFYYLERCEKCTGDDETIVVRTDKEEVFVTYDHGKVWETLPKVKSKIAQIVPHDYVTDRVFFLTKDKRIYYSKNRAQDIYNFDTPLDRDTRNALSFHPKQADWLIYLAKNDNQVRTFVSKRNGDDWSPLLRGVDRCEFVYSDLRPNSTDLIYCAAHAEEDPKSNLTLYSSTDLFNSKEELKDNVVNFATMSEYIVVALKDDQGDLKVDATVDGKTFADAHFPRNFRVEHQRSYAVLDSSTHSIFLHVTTYSENDQAYGSIIKSNSNGTNYVLSISNVNRDSLGFVDFEKIIGLEGAMLVNVVANPESVATGEDKKLKTLGSHNDGAEFGLLRRPESSGSFDVVWCNGDVSDCSLHLHGYTEREDFSKGMSSQTAIGLVIAHGNVGQYLGDIKDADTFMSRDGGVEWKMIAKGAYGFAFGDRGSIVVIVEKRKATKNVQYSLDEGESWETYQFSDDEMVVDRITTVPSDTSRMFLLWGKIDGHLATVNLDFSGLKERSKKCTLDEEQPGSSKDYYLWSPKHPLSKSDCLFGHKAKYYRKDPEASCYNGRTLPTIKDKDDNCECTRADYECEYNFEPQSDGTCKLVAGLDPVDPQEVCKDPDVFEYYEAAPYRRIGMTTCVGGTEFDKQGTPKACPGKEDLFNGKHPISGVGLFFAIVIPIGFAAAAGWYVWRNFDGKFGSIRLGDGGSGSRIGLGGAFDSDAPWVRYPVLALSAVVAVVASIPMVVSTVYRTLRTRFDRRGGRFTARPYTSRDSFQRGRGNYSIVEDEGELLGNESDEDEI